MEVVMREYPTVVHFGCHSSQEEGLALIQRKVSAEVMAEGIDACNLLAFQKKKPGVRVMIFNACESNVHAQQLSTCVDFAIGHCGDLDDKLDAIGFSKSF